MIFGGRIKEKGFCEFCVEKAKLTAARLDQFYKESHK